ncbi:aspartate aminotransferase family protein [Metabacillus idriensis]|uniref:aspartate aminotransferase family protein n=1 Tax=Metabacillus idriensis TaxID=324768 RepID=UPI003D282EDD
MKYNSSLSERALKVLPPVANRATSIGVTSAYDSTVVDENGKKYLDFASGVGVNNVGHCHPEVINAVKEQLDSMIHIGHNVAYYPSYIELAETLNDLTGTQRMVYFSNSGAEANEGAIKLAKKATKRPAIISFKRGFHGRTIATTSITFSSSAYRKDYEGLLPSVYLCEYPYTFRTGLSDEEETRRCIQSLEDVFQYQVDPSQVAAMILEPIQGEGGYIVPPKGFLKQIREICDQFGILLIFDEVQTGFGRTGKMFAYEHFGVEPDILTLGKGIASGFPLSALVAKREIMEKWEAGTHGGTYGGNPVSCSAALASIKILKREGIENAEKMGNYFKQKLLELKNVFKGIGDVRGLGLMIGVEFIDHKGKPDSQKVTDMREYALENGLILLPCGSDKNVLRFIPPVTVLKSELDQAFKVIEEGLRKLDKKESGHAIH